MDRVPAQIGAESLSLFIMACEVCTAIGREEEIDQKDQSLSIILKPVDHAQLIRECLHKFFDKK